MDPSGTPQVTSSLVESNPLIEPYWDLLDKKEFYEFINFSSKTIIIQFIT